MDITSVCIAFCNSSIVVILYGGRRDSRILFIITPSE